MAEDAGVGDEEAKEGSLTRGLFMAIKDWKTWWMCERYFARLLNTKFKLIWL